MTTTTWRRDKFDSKVPGLQSKCHKQRAAYQAAYGGAKSRQQRNRLPEWDPNKAEAEAEAKADQATLHLGG